MSIFIQEVLGLLKRNQKKVTLDKVKDWFEFGKLYQSSSLNNKSGYTPKMDPFVIKWGDLVCQATEDLTRTLPGQGNLGFIPVYTDPSGFCSWDTLKDSIITQNALNTIINIAGSLQVAGDVQISGGDLTATTSTFNLLNTAPVSTINFGGTATNIEMSSLTGVVNINGTTQSTSCTTGALVIDGGVGIAKDLFVCGNANIAGDVEISGGDLTTTATTFNLINANATTVNFAGAGTAISIGAATGTTTINNANTVVTGDLAVNGGDLTSTATTFNLLNQSTNINFGSNSQNIVIGGANATMDVTILGTQESTSCTTGALVVNGGVGIAKNLNVCANLTVAGVSTLNGNVNLGDAIGDNIRLYGKLLDNNGNTASANQVLVGQTGGGALWQNDDVVETLTYGAIWRGNSLNVKEELLIGATGTVLISNGTTLNWTAAPWITSFNVTGNTGGTFAITEANTLSILGGTAITTAVSSVDTVTINHSNSGVVAGIYNYPSMVTTNAQGHITNITNGSAPMQSVLVGADSGPVQTIANGETLYINGNTGIATVATNDTITASLTNTGVSAGTYSNPTLDIDAQGRITNATNGVPVVTGPKVLVGLISQNGTSAPVFTIIQNDFTGVTFGTTYVNVGLYSLVASAPVFTAGKTATYIIANVAYGKQYFAAINRSNDTALSITSFNYSSGSGAGFNNEFQLATLKVEVYQ